MYLLTELVRLLEERGHIFPSDPKAITETLRQTDEDVEAKLHRRARIIDRRHALRDRLDSHRRHADGLKIAATALWFIIGFAATYGLMQQDSLNFFFLLIGTLGINSLMLLLWFIGLGSKKTPKNLPFSLFLTRERDALGQALSQLYAQQLTLPYARWQRSLISHRLALSGLIGMFCATLLLLTVRQYGFNWQSTLLSDKTFANTVRLLAWLPEQLGFAVPDTDAVMKGRNAHDVANASQWGSLLLGSLLCYGILPRILAWALSLWQARTAQPALDLRLPYYQNLIQQWQRKIVDSAADYQADEIIPTPPIRLSAQGAHWAALLDVPYHDATWYERQLGQDWLNQGVLADREQIADLVEQLTQTPAQLLLGVRAQHVPDRGTVRTITRLTDAAQNGVIIQLLLPETVPGNQSEVIAQWREVLQQHGWTWLEPQA